MMGARRKSPDGITPLITSDWGLNCKLKIGFEKKSWPGPVVQDILHFTMTRPPVLLFLSALLLAAPFLQAHPIPDIPVRGYFYEGGAAKILVEVNPRCFEKDPTSAPSLLRPDFDKLSADQKEALKVQAAEYVKGRIAFYLEPLGQVTPAFDFEFNKQKGTDETEDQGEEVMVLTGTWETTIPAGISGYRIKAHESGDLSVQFLNEVRGQPLERIHVLFPGESSFTLDLADLASTTAADSIPGAVQAGDTGWWDSFVTFFRQGFVHVLPKGLDHILFVLGLFLLSRQLRPLIYQVTCFTLAHTLTLGMATLGWVNAPASVVEPVIALSIAVVALENIFHPRYTHWRLLIVFAFGLIHGLGFAGALSELDLPTGSLIVGLLGFNVGVEFGQLAVIALALLATFAIRDMVTYRRWVVVPGSILIAGMGLWWFVERAFL